MHIDISNNNFVNVISDDNKRFSFFAKRGVKLVNMNYF
jgi:hypothetical protein